MSCQENDRIEEASWEAFYELISDDRDLLIKAEELYLSRDEQYLVWKEDHDSREYIDFEEVFSKMWKYDPELVVSNLRLAVVKFFEIESMREWLASGGTND